jgi:hypothetical protein
MKRMVMIFASVGGGLLIATAAVWLGWLVQIEGRAFQCNDILWLIAWPSPDLSQHRQAGVTLSPGWTWETIERVGRAYQVAFFFLWVGGTALISAVWSRRWRQNQAVHAIGAAAPQDDG